MPLLHLTLHSTKSLQGEMDRSFKNFHYFGSPAFVLGSITQKGHVSPTLRPLSIPSRLFGKSRERNSNTSLVFNHATNSMSLRFHMACDDKIQTLPPSSSNSSPSNWREVFQTDYCGDNESFKTPLETKLDNERSYERSFLGCYLF